MMQQGERPARDTKEDNDEQLCWEMIDSVNSIVLRWDTALRVTFINDFALEFFGFRREDILGQSIVGTIVPPKSDTGRDLVTMVRNIVSSPERFINNENENIRSDGTRVWVSWTNRAVRDREGRVDEILSVGNDVTRRKKAEEALKGQLKMTQTLLDAIPIPVFYKDANGIYTGCNRAFAAFLGKSKSEIVGKNVYELSPPDLADIYHRADEELIHHPGTQVYETSVVYADGTRHDVIFNKATYLNEDGTVGGLIGTILDITKRKKIERELIKAREELEQRVLDRTKDLEQANESLRREANEHMRDEEALRESEERFRAVFEQAAVGISITSLDGITLRPNDKLCQITGYDCEELIGQSYNRFVYPGDMDIDREERRKLIAGEISSFSVDKRFIRKSGEIVWAHVTISRAQDNEGKPQYVIAIVQDITDSKRAEETLRRSGQMFVSVFRHSPSQLVISNARDGRILEVNDSFVRETGHSREEAIGNTIVGLGLVTDEQLADIRARVAARGRVDNLSFTYRKKNGKESHGLISIDSIEFEGQQCLISTTIDVTEAWESRRALAESEEEFRVLVESSPAAILFHQGGNFIYVNPAAAELSGYTKEQLLNMKFWDIIAPEYRAIARERGIARLQGGNPPPRYEIRILTADGTERWTEINSTPMEFRGKRSALVVALDVTQRRQAEEAVKKARARAELYLDLMGHDISNMNQAMMGYLEMAQELLDLKGHEELIERPLEIIKHSSRLIANVKKLELIQAGKYPIKTANMCQALKEAVNVHAVVPGRDVKINVSPAEGCIVEANDLLTDVFDNLIDNAIRHSAGPLVVDISIEPVLEDGRKYYMVSVADNGPGIPDDLKRKIFRFIDPATGSPGRRGLGLYMVRTLVESYHGRVWAEDRIPGDYHQGSRFVVLLPAAEAAKMPREDARAPL